MAHGSYKGYAYQVCKASVRFQLGNSLPAMALYSVSCLLRGSKYWPLLWALPSYSLFGLGLKHGPVSCISYRKNIQGFGFQAWFGM